MNGSPDRHGIQMALDEQLRNEFRAFENAIAAMAAALSPALAETFIELAIEQILADYAHSTCSPEAPKVYMALGRRLREGVWRRLDELGKDESGRQ